MVAAMTSHNTLDAYPWGIELAKLDLKDEDIAIVDVAGGQGHVSKLSLDVPPGRLDQFLIYFYSGMPI